MDLAALLTLMSVPHIGIIRARRLVDHFGSPEEVLCAPPEQIAALPDMGHKTAQSIPLADYDAASQQLKKMNEAGARCVTLWDEDYPPRLKNIYDPPPYLFYRGSLDWMDDPALAVVGTRKVSAYGRSQTKNIVSVLARQGMVIVSGMARGIDSEAHKAAIEAGGKTAAVLGCGLDIVYPPENRKLRDSIIENGAVISEFPFGTAPNAQNFPRRNRVISGLSLGTLVVEAGNRSGALITTAYAVDQDREAFAVPGDVSRLQSEGCNRLIKTGRAHLVTCGEDILEVLGTQLGSGIGKPEKKREVSLQGNELKLYDILDNEPIYIDDLARKADMIPSEALTVLLQLEMKELVRPLPGKMYLRS